MFKKLTSSQLPIKDKNILLIGLINNKNSPICQITKYYDNKQQLYIFLQQNGNFLYIENQQLLKFAWIYVDQLIEKVENFLLNDYTDKIS